MIIKKQINIPDEKLLSGLIPVLEIIGEIENNDDNDIEIDLSDAKFVSPLFVLPLMVFVHGSNRNIRYSNISGYLNQVKFGTEFRPDDIRRSEFLAHMANYTHKTYLPIISFPALKKNDEDKSSILSTIESIIAKQLQLDTNIITGLKYLIGESVDNITEHSDSERGYIFAQAYPTKGYIDICIADNGITLLGSYKKLQGNEIELDIEAIQAANRGISTKNLPNAENRGFGIITSKKMLVDGLGGHYVMLSGEAIHIKSKGVDNFLLLPNNIRWEGTIVAFRIPFKNKTFSYINYLE